VEAAELVPGDIVVLEEGDAVPADLRLVDVSDLHVVEALLTGESEPVAKSSAALLQRKLGVGERRNMAFMNTAVAKGRAVGIVVATGSATEVGKISDALVRPSDSTTLLQRRLSRLGKILVVISVVLCLVIVAIGLLRTYFAGGAVTSEEALKWIKVYCLCFWNVHDCFVVILSYVCCSQSPYLLIGWRSARSVCDSRRPRCSNYDHNVVGRSANGKEPCDRAQACCRRNFGVRTRAR
jgi:cation transport ATPase